MVNHGLVVAPIFVIVAILLERSGTEDIREMGGIAMRAPVLAALFLIVTLATLAMPGSANFVGEFYILNGLFDAKIVFAIVAISGVAMSAYYALRLYQRTMHNRKPDGILSREISLRDGVVLVPLVLCILGLALYPQLILKRTDPSAQQAVTAACGWPQVEGGFGFGPPRISGDNCPGDHDERVRGVPEQEEMSKAVASTSGETQ
jgi:NADH-quinone oxidoreductase subunit M